MVSVAAYTLENDPIANTAAVNSDTIFVFIACKPPNLFYEGRYIKDYDMQGKSIIGYVYGKTYKDAKEKLLVAKAQVKQRQNKPPSEMFVKDWFEKWLSTQKHIKKSSYTVYSSLIDKHINTELGNIRLCDITKFTVQDFINGLV